MRKQIFFIILLLPFLYGKVLHPQGNMVGELLDIQGKVREYYLLDNHINITATGPSIVYIYARLAVPKNEKGVHSFSFKSSLSNVPASFHKFNKKIDSSVSSLLHPMHRYTNSGKIEIEIPKGEFMLSLKNLSNFGNPILTRVVQKRHKK